MAISKRLPDGGTLQIVTNITEVKKKEKEFNFLYSDDNGCFFMDPESFEQISIKKDLLGDKIKLLTENLKVTISFLEENPLSVDLPTNIAVSYTHLTLPTKRIV